MICSKCNNEIPNGAKFCTVCGTPCAAAEPAKTFCAKCGLELAPGAKFCTSCGTPTASSPVSLGKEPGADDLVAAMNTAAPAAVPTPAPVPTPAAVPTPTAPAASAVPQPVQAPAASVMPQPTYNNGFAPTSAPNDPSIPAYAPTSGQMPVAGDPAGFNGVAAAVVPDKVKKSPAGKIVLVIVCVLVALIGGAAGWFFANKPSFLSTFMGKPKYAAMVEKQTFKEISKDLDTAQLSSQIKTFSSVMTSLMTTNQMGHYGGYGFMSDNSADAAYAPMMNSYSNNPFEDVDFSGMIKSYHEFMQSTYGANAISGKMSLKIDNLGAIDDEDVEAVLDILNGMTINYNYAASEDALGTIIGAEFGNGSEIDIKAVAQDDGSIYISFPFASKTGFKIKTNSSGSSSDTMGTEGLDLDPDEIERLLEELVAIYSKHVETASVTMEKGSLFVSGKEVSGKLIVADINGPNLENLFKEMFEHIANDTYFSTQIVDYINNFDDSYTVSDFKNDVTDLVSDMSVDPGDKLVIRTIVNNGGKTLAKSFAFVSDGEVGAEFLFADNNQETAFEIKADGDTVMNMLNEKTDDKSGKITITVSDFDAYDSSSAISVFVDYSGVEKVTYGKTEIEVGTYTVSMNVPRDGSFDDEEIDMINNSSFTVGTTVNGNTVNYNIGATISGVAKFDFNMDLTYSDDTSALSTPSDVIDITDAVNGGEPDKATQEKLTTFLGELMTAVENSGLEEIFGNIGGGSVVTPTPGPTGPTTPVDTELRQKYYDLQDEIWDAYYEVYSWIDAYETKYDSDAYNVAKNYQDALWDVYDKIGDEVYSANPQLSEKQLGEFRKEFEDIYGGAEEVLKVLWSASTIPEAPSPTLPFDPGSGHIDPTPSGGVYDANGSLITTPAFGTNER